ncbi:MAG: hypothetical protein QXP45_02660 [Thermoproteota archaeon]
MEKVRRLLEEFTGLVYEVKELEPGSRRLRISPRALEEGKSVQMKEKESKQVSVRVEVFSEGIFAVSFPGFTKMFKHAERYYQIYMWPDEVMKSRDPNAREVARRFAPGIIKDCETVEKATREAGLKYLADPNALEIDFNWIRIESKFKAEKLVEEEILKEVEKRVKAVSEVIVKFWIWYESEERKNIYEQTRIKKELRHDRAFEADWPPNTGSPEKDKEKYELVEERLRFKTRVYTPKGELELKNGEIVLKKKKKE